MDNQKPQRPGSGVLFTNRNKTNPRAPDFKGELHIPEGVVPGSTIKIAGWKRTTKIGDLISLAVDKRVLDYPKDVTPKSDSDLPW